MQDYQSGNKTNTTYVWWLPKTVICPHCNNGGEKKKRVKACIPLNDAIWNGGDTWFENILSVVLIVNPEQLLNGQYWAVLLQGGEALPHGSLQSRQPQADGESPPQAALQNWTAS